jgi:hypothetical protein
MINLPSIITLIQQNIIWVFLIIISLIVIIKNFTKILLIFLGIVMLLYAGISYFNITL